MKVYAAGKSKWSKFWAIKFPKKSNAFSKSLHAKQAKSKLLSNYLFSAGYANSNRNLHLSIFIAANELQIAEGGELEVQILNKAQMIIRSTTLDFSTASPLLAICCYVSVFFFIFCAWAIKSLNH